MFLLQKTIPPMDIGGDRLLQSMSNSTQVKGFWVTPAEAIELAIANSRKGEYLDHV
ncbi:hypothetical protein [Laspinema olomoucense]|uniref:hypothetical protein n=1 Tax=Laspinema olomoucense TaxID=3231600 RepID=UPI0021BAE7AB|nr:hypothetical protein [Laspinema sp. D3c]MCT7997351.1 hypothetical protein [Laspinema sp. D3c]